MSIWLVVGSDIVCDHDRVSILNTSFHQLVVDVVGIQKLGDSGVAVGSLNQNMRQFILNTKLFQKTLDVHHNEGKLFVSVNDFEIALFIAIVIHLPICISIEGDTLFTGVLIWRPSSWSTLIFMDVLGTTLMIQVVWGLLAIDQDKRQSFRESINCHHLLDRDCSHSVSTIKH